MGRPRHRKPKEHEAPETLYDRWRAEAVDRGHDPDTLVRQVTGRARDRDQDRVQVVTGDVTGRLFDHLAKVSQLLPAESQSKQYRSLQLAAEHLLSAGEFAFHAQATPLDTEQKPEALLHYVIALEALLSEDDREISHKVAQRTAVLAGRNDAERLTVFNFTKAAYTARSQYAHGGKPQRLHRLISKSFVTLCAEYF